VAMDETPTKIKTKELQRARWMLTIDQQLMKLNMRTNEKP